MKSPNISTPNLFWLGSNSTKNNNDTQGFTLIEVLVAISIFTITISMGLVFSFDSYRNYILRNEYNTVFNLMTQARSKAMNNIDQSTYTFEVLNYEYRIYPTNNPNNYISLPRNINLAILPGEGSYEFLQLSGNVPECKEVCSISLSNGLMTKNLNINAAGGIISI